ncbi:MAG TPA: type II toxin-antitoxin system VapC family toxin [Limnochordales bacterium]
MKSIGVVVDASVALAWVLQDEESAYADRVLRYVAEADASIHVPSLWLLEIGNALLAAERRGRLLRADVERAAALLTSLPIAMHSLEARNLPRLMDLARSYHLSVYDSTYLALSIDQGLPLATLDDQLRRAAADSGVDYRG